MADQIKTTTADPSTAELAKKITEWLKLANINRYGRAGWALNKIDRAKSTIVNWLMYNDESGRFRTFMEKTPGWFDEHGRAPSEHLPYLHNKDMLALLHSLDESYP